MFLVLNIKCSFLLLSLKYYVIYRTVSSKVSSSTVSDPVGLKLHVVCLLSCNISSVFHLRQRMPVLCPVVKV